MPDTSIKSFRAGNMLVQTGCSQKTTDHLEVRFRLQFDKAPSVTVTPFWDHQHQGVGFAETIEAITSDGFVIVSSNKASNYFVSWVAIGEVDRPD